MHSSKRINSALISVYHKHGLAPVIEALHALGITLYATGGTQTFIEAMKIPVVPVEDLTSYPSILGGRVKTLHPKIFGGILSRRENAEDVAQIEEYEIPELDLVIVDLYPFEDTVKSFADANSLSPSEPARVGLVEGRGEMTKDIEATIIEKIDIGGISLIRAAAKNYSDVVIIPSLNDYSWLLNVLKEQKGETTLEQRKKQAAKAFAVSSHYDTAIFNWFRTDENYFKQSIMQSMPLRYGENPHQEGKYFGNLDEIFEKLSGKELSYNNLLDIDSAVALMIEFNEPTFAILKHNNACGCASRPVLVDAWKAALAADPVSAFGGVIVTNKKVSVKEAAEINQLFFEVLIAPNFEDAAVELLKEKKNRILLKQKNFKYPSKQFRTILNGVLEQDRDSKTESAGEMKVVTAIAPTSEELDNLAFAMKICKHSKSNTIVLVKDKMLIGSGVGMTSRVDALKHAIEKSSRSIGIGLDLNGAVMASDAFFPFPDCVEIA
ncbi:MAG: bifunctional phosphoribosylaminoimidazolecarboxamide formyltransferase/IMP cyclohydrolase PurH, partial [Bacteroidia bacterium]